MTEADDLQLLRDYTESLSDAAFAALVTRHVNLVYSVALRQTGNPHAAEEVTQAVFIILARKAGSLGPKTILSGWLYQTARLTAANFLRGQRRRQQREQEAYMQSLSNESEREVWPQIAPLLDEALGKLGERDRHAIVLRFFENKRLDEVGAALGASEDAAKMRVNRALERLRRIFTKSGVTLTTAFIAGSVSANSVQAAPVGLAVTITATATKGTAVAGSIATLVNGTMKSMTWLKLKLWLGLGTATALAGAAIAVGIVLSADNNHLSAYASPGFAVSGTFSIEATRSNQGRQRKTSGVFSIAYRDGQWLIRSKRYDQDNDYDEAGYDGQSVYSISSMKSWVDERRQQGKPVGVNIAEGVIVPGTEPYRDPEINKVLWLLYASSRNLAEAPDKSLPALFSHSSRKAYLYGFRQRADWVIGDRNPGLPQFAVFYDDGFVRRWNDEDAGYMTGPPISDKWASPYDQGFTNAILSVSSASITNGNWIPRTATFTVYAPKPGGDSVEDLDLLRTITINTTNFVFGTSIQDFKPSVDGVVLVTDQRFERETKPVFQVSYRIEHRWPTIGEVREGPEYQAARAKQRKRIAASNALVTPR